MRPEPREGSPVAINIVLKDVMRELAALEAPKMREANERRGDDHGVNLTHLRALAKRLKTQHELALQLWATGDTAARLLATLVCMPKSFAATELEVMIRGIRSPKLLDWFVVNVLQQQAPFDDFIERYNRERPHPALGMNVPAERYARSARVYRALRSSPASPRRRH